MIRKILFADLCLLFVALIWGLNPPVMKLALYDVTPMVFNALRMFVAAIASGIILYATRSYKRFAPGDLWKLIKYSLIGYAGFQILLISRLRYTSSTNSALIFALLPVSVLLIGRFSKAEKVSKAVLVGISVSLGGVLLIIINTGQSFSLANNNLIGSMLLLIGQGFYGYYTVFSKDMLDKYSINQVSFFVILFTCIFFLVVAIPDLWRTNLSQITSRALVCSLFSGVLSVSVGNFLWIWGTTIIGSTRTAVYSNVSPVFAAIGGYILLGETITLLQVIGGVIIFVGLYLSKESPPATEIAIQPE